MLHGLRENYDATKPLKDPQLNHKIVKQITNAFKPMQSYKQDFSILLSQRKQKNPVNKT